MPQIPNLEGFPLLIATPHLLTDSMLKAIAPARAADFYGFSGITEERNHTLLGLGKLVLEFAKICNFTPVSTYIGDIIGRKINEEEYKGTIIPLIVPSVLPNYYYETSKTKSSISFSILQFFNFLYCDLDRQPPPTNPALLLRPFDYLCWIIILALTLAISVVINWKRRDFFTCFYMVFAALFSQTISDTIRDRTKIFIFWTFICVVLNTLYSGVLTSLLIAPVEKNLMRSLDDLVQNDFKLVYSEDGYYKYIMKMATHMEPQAEIGTSGIKNRNKLTDRKSALDILSKSIVMKETTNELMDSLAFESKTAIFGPWMMAMVNWRILSIKNEARNKKVRKIKQRSCHIGKYLNSAHAHPEMWIFKLSDKRSSGSFSHVFNRIYANGIHGFWMGVFTQMQATLRIQDMNRFKSKTEVMEEIPIEPLGFHVGSVVVIFVLYGACILICCIGFVAEKLWSHRSSFNKLQYPS